MPIWLASFASKLGIKGFALVGAAVALALCWAGWTHAANQRDAQIRENGALSLKLETSNASIDLLQDKIADMNADIERRAKEYEASKALAEKRATELAKLERSTDARIARIKAIRGDGSCPVPDALIDELGGL